MSIARPTPISRGKRCVPPAPGINAKSTSGSANRAAKSDLQPSAKAEPVNSHDDRLLDSGDSAGVVEIRGRQAHGSARERDALFLNVGTDAKCALALSLNHHRANSGIAGHLAARIDEANTNSIVDGVHRLATRQRHDSHALTQFDLDAL
jgi:hypothetical protein